MKTVQKLRPAALFMLYLCLYGGAYSAVLCPNSSIVWFVVCAALYALLTLLSRLSEKQKDVLLTPFFVPECSRNYVRLPVLCLTTISLVFLFHTVLIAPASAQFYGQAQSFIETCFPQASSAVPIVFNVLRFLFLIYLGVALIQGITAVREGQSLIAVATPPLIVVAVVAVGDIMSDLIIGGATC